MKTARKFKRIYATRKIEEKLKLYRQENTDAEVYVARRDEEQAKANMKKPEFWRLVVTWSVRGLSLGSAKAVRRS